MADDLDLGEQVISKAAEAGMSSQLDEVEKLEVRVHTDPISLSQGEIQSVDVKGKGLVMQGDLRAEELELTTDGIAINPMKAAFGNIELTRSSNATAEVVLTAEDIERAFNSDFIRQKMQGLTVNLNDQQVHIEPKHVDFSIPNSEKVAIAADVTVPETGETHHVAFSASPEVGPQGHQVILKDVVMESEKTPEAFSDALLKAARELLDLRNFELDGMTFQLQQINVQTGRMTLHAKARLEKFPGN